MFSAIKSLGERVKRSTSGTNDSTSSHSAVTARLPLTPLQMANYALPTLAAERGGKVRKGQRGILIDLIASYNNTNDSKLRIKKRNEIRKIQFEWLERLRKETKKDDSDKLKSKIDEVEKWEASFLDITQDEELFNASFASIPAVTSSPLSSSSSSPVSHIPESKAEAAPTVESKAEAVSVERTGDFTTARISKYLSTCAAKYKEDRSFLSTHGTNSAGSSVGWKAHIGATAETAIDVLECVIPILIKNNISHKVDLNPNVFKVNNKFITIYPPGGEDDWALIVDALDTSLRRVGETVRVPGELLVGTKGLVSMRHGQITAVGYRNLLVNDIDFDMGSSMDEYKLTNPKQYDNDIVDGKLTFKGGTLTAVHKTKGECAIIIVNGKIYVDPRSEPNPNNFPLPKGVVPYGDLN